MGKARDPEPSSLLSLPLIKYWLWLGMKTGLKITESNCIAQRGGSWHPNLYASSWLKWLSRSYQKKNAPSTPPPPPQSRSKEKSSTDSYISHLISSCRYKSHRYCDVNKLQFLAQKDFPFWRSTWWRNPNLCSQKGHSTIITLPMKHKVVSATLRITCNLIDLS